MASKVVQHRGGNTPQHSTFTGAQREITVDTTKKTLVVHDGVTPGGTPLAKESDLNGLLSKNGGVMTGVIINLTENVVILGNSSNLDLLTGTYFKKTINNTTAFTVSNVPSSGKLCSIVIELTNGGSSVIGWPSSTKWPSGIIPTFATNGKDIVILHTVDGGSTWIASVHKDVR